MAQFNEILVGRFNRGIQKLFGQKGRVPAPQLASEIAVIHPLQSGAENRYLEGWDRFFINVGITSAAGNFANYRIRNPVGSNRVAVFEKIVLFSSILASVQTGFGAGTTDLATAGVGNGRIDARGGQNTNLVQSSTTADAFTHLPGAPFFSYQIPAGQQVELIVTDIHEFQLLPGDEFGVAQAAGTGTLTVAMLWRERFLEESERT